MNNLSPTLLSRILNWKLFGIRVFPKYGPYSSKASFDGIRWRWHHFLPWESAIEVYRVRFGFRRYFYVRFRKELRKSIREAFIPIKLGNEKPLFDEILKCAPAGSPFRRCIENDRNESWVLFRSKSVWFTSGLLLLSLSFPMLAPLPVKMTAKKRFLEQSQAEDAAKVWPEFLNDRALLEAYPFFTSARTHSKDAGELLNGQMPEYKEKAHSPPRRLMLPEKMTADLGIGHEAWRKRRSDWASLRLDFSWMKDLLAYDYWDSDAGKPKSNLELEANLDNQWMFYEISILGDWAQLRLQKSVSDGDQQEALREVLHLADLLWTSETIDALYEAIHLLELSSSFALDQHVAYEGIPAPAIQAARRYFDAQGAYLDPRIPIDLVRGAIDTKVGICSLAREGVVTALAVRTYFGSDYRDYLSEIEKLLGTTSNSCRADFWRKIWNDPNFSLNADTVAVFSAKAKSENHWLADKWIRLIGPVFLKVAPYGYIMASMPKYRFYSYTHPPIPALPCPKN